MTFNPRNWQIQDAIKERVYKEDLISWANKDNFMELPSGDVKKIKFTLTSAFIIGRQMFKMISL